MTKGKSNAIGNGMKLIACSVEIPLVNRIDELAQRDGITRATWIREAIIEAAKGDKKFQRTPVIRETVIPLTTSGYHGSDPRLETASA
jgi:metal-responsive CopG/Arc/MetJ family transcriptional regulator